MLKLTCQEFCKEFDVYITFDRTGWGQIFGKGSHPPKLMEKESFWIPTDGNDTGLLPQLVTDYYEYSKLHKAILISPDDDVNKIEKEKEKLKDGKIPRMECKDFKDGDEIGINVDVIHVAGWQDTAHLKLDETIYHITLFDGKHHFVYDTKAKEHPEEGQKVFVKAKIKKQTDQTDFEIPAFEITSVKILKAKKS